MDQANSSKGNLKNGDFFFFGSAQVNLNIHSGDGEQWRKLSYAYSPPQSKGLQTFKRQEPRASTHLWNKL